MRRCTYSNLFKLKQKLIEKKTIAKYYWQRMVIFVLPCKYDSVKFKEIRKRESV